MRVAGVAGHRAVEAVGVPAKGVRRARHVDLIGQLLALGPELKFARRVAGVVAHLEAGNHDHFDRDFVSGSGGI